MEEKIRIIREAIMKLVEHVEYCQKALPDQCNVFDNIERILDKLDE